ncbi:DUF4177 domain-containing protein [Sulfurovum sp.]|uniref:DUF4177 domain-containing protein n=1 Tax=Sulfurovum sp. TaxID=1969726 RepID=UPI002867ECD8|nr:DUF4177 domain-containing protein [Sulfurovum sp.]
MQEKCDVEYKAIVYQESMLGSLLLGGAKVDPVKLSNFLNKNAQNGWRVVTMEKDIRRMLLFFKREAYVILMIRDTK